MSVSTPRILDCTSRTASSVGMGRMSMDNSRLRGKVGQVFYHFVADKRCVVAHKQDAPKLAAHFKISCAELQSVRANQVAEVDAALDIRRQIKPERRFFAGPEEIMQEPQPIGAGDRISTGIQPPKAGEMGLVSTRLKYARVCSIFRRPMDSVIYIFPAPSYYFRRLYPE